MTGCQGGGARVRGGEGAGCSGAAPAQHKAPSAPRGFSAHRDPRLLTRFRDSLPHYTADADPQHAIVYTCERGARPFSHAV
ncbi:hypothetical protein RR48_15313 [Papilio machaon]|uniref:Uncharacterized protein n=1 Tax=Papilio machaon TaxID=76193 RepID=A0A194QUM7_PAPMA|nr:hypothetical protein RR48_15313 [Papilio machaon]